ncbi:beta-ketoacyl synthase N-terminal-like domain-containing protein [Streptomyces sp. MspMP-M5]|uniref:beta-ketoacyl synthase N-terminal-like domain-containing protein n=1 Tax=unclassified Streptomyces TaxID=2593676 RepID=UPI0004766A31|nr:beta-ketoacyl synthase N-terminal-like domain-containing protein [Streptomyces sp. MspMP-M5]
MCLGSIIGGAPVLAAASHTLRDHDVRRVSPHTAPMTVPNSASAHLAIELGLRGEARTIFATCASGTEAIGQATDRIRTGAADIVIAGGTEAVITPEVMASFIAMRALTARNDEPASRPGWNCQWCRRRSRACGPGRGAWPSGGGWPCRRWVGSCRGSPP